MNTGKTLAQLMDLRHGFHAEPGSSTGMAAITGSTLSAITGQADTGKAGHRGFRNSIQFRQPVRRYDANERRDW